METMLEKLGDTPKVLSEFVESLTEKEARTVTKARRQGLVRIYPNVDNVPMIEKVVS